LKRKAEKGQSDLTLIAENDYVTSFAVHRDAWDKVLMGSDHEQSRALEFGYEPRGLAARPHFWPGIEEGTEEFLEELQHGLSDMFKSLMR